MKVSREQIDALLHPLRIRILAELTSSEKLRTSDIATALGEAPNKISYHASILEKEGLISKVKSQTDQRETWWKMEFEGIHIEDENISREQLPAIVAIMSGFKQQMLLESLNYTYSRSGYAMLQCDRLIPLSKRNAEKAREILTEAYRKVQELDNAQDADDLYYIESQLLPLRPATDTTRTAATNNTISTQ